MAPNSSRHHLPLNSILFETQIFSKTEHNPTFANLQDAPDSTITAVPRLPTPITTTKEAASAPAKKTAWRRIQSKIKKLFGGSKKKGEGLRIGAPTDFKHEKTGGPMPLRTGHQPGPVGGAKRDEEGTAVEEEEEEEEEEENESDWEDVEETRVFGVM